MTSKLSRCAIYTRKSTEHGLELEFNSLDAQREACEAYIKSQAHEGWRPLPDRYDDPAFSGGNLDRPALRRLLADIDAGRVDVVVVYKIDRLTRSLADFAKLVELFDRKGISFVAVTQQFNTTTSMGRLTLNVLLSFAQFERELSSERVRDKVAASRRKGKWTGGGLPIGYDAKNKKLIVNETEAETVRHIFRRYLELRCLARLTEDLHRCGIVSKRRPGTNRRRNGGARFTYGALAHLLKNRTYLGETGHKEAWFPGEHEAIVPRELFEQVQQVLRANSVTRRLKRSVNAALLTGLLFDDRGNRMSPSFSTKRGVRYRFYVSSALLRGRKQDAGSVPRVSAPVIENTILAALRASDHAELDLALPDRAVIENHVTRIDLSEGTLAITMKPKVVASPSDEDKPRVLIVPWSNPSNAVVAIEHDGGQADRKPDETLVQAVARAHSWIQLLSDGTHGSIEELATSINLNPKVVRKSIRLAFIPPDIIEAILDGKQPPTMTLSELHATLPLSWSAQRKALGFNIMPYGI